MTGVRGLGPAVRTHGGPVAFLALVACVLLWRLLFLGELPYSEAYQSHFAPWRASGAPVADVAAAGDPTGDADPMAAYGRYWSSLLHDDVDATVWPDHVEARRQLRDGEWPLWNPRMLGGVPLAANGMSGVASPFSWPAYVLPLAFGRALTLALHLLLAGVAMYAFLIDSGRRRAAATAGAALFMLNPLHVHWLYFGFAVPSNALFPLMLMALRRMAVEPRPWRAAGALAALVGLALLGVNNASLLVFLAVVPAVGAFVFAPPDRRLRTVGLALAAALLGAMAASVAVMPFLELMSSGLRSTAKYTGTNHLSPAWLFAWPFPRLFGHPAAGDYVGGLLFGRPYSTTYGVGVGSLAFVVAVLGGVARRRKALLAGVAVIVLGLTALSVGAVHEVAAAVFPPLDSMDVVRSLVLVYFALSLLVADGVEALADGVSSRLAWAPAAALVAAVGLALGVGALGPDTSRLAGYLAEVALSWRTLVPLAVVVALALSARLLHRHRAFGAGLAVALTAELVGLAAPSMVSTPPERLAPPTPALTALRAAVDAAPQPARMVGLNDADSFPPYTADNVPPNLGGYLGFEDLRGFPLVHFAPMGELLAFAAGRMFPAAAYFTAAELGRPVFDLLNVRWVLARGPLPSPRFRAVVPGLWENTQAGPRAFFTRCTRVIEAPEARLEALVAEDFRPMAAAVVEAPVPGIDACDDATPFAVDVAYPSPRRASLNVTAPSAGVLVLADAWYPGWQVAVDGVPGVLLQVDHALRGVALPPGPHRVEFHFAPDAATDGLWLTLLGAGLIALLLYGRRPPLSDDVLLGLLAAALIGVFVTAAPLPNDNDALYAGVARTLTEGGSLVGLSLEGTPFLDKPPLFFIVEAALTSLLGSSLLALLVFPMLCGVAGVVLTARVTRALSGSRVAAAVAGLALLCAPNYYEYCRRVYMEVPVAVFGFWAWDLGRRTRWGGAGASAGAAFMLKSVVGVLGIAAVALAELAARRRWKGVLVGAGVALALVVPWHVAAYLHDPQTFLDFTVNLHVRDQMASAQPWSTGGPFFYVDVLLTQDTAMGLLLVIGLPLGVALWRRERDFALGALLLAVVLQLLCYSVIATKKPFYLLTAYPFIAVLGAWMLHRFRPHLVTAAAALCGALFLLQNTDQLLRNPVRAESTYLEPLARHMAAVSAPGDALVALDVYLAAPQYYAHRPTTYAVQDAAVVSMLARIPYLRYGQKVVLWDDARLAPGTWVIAPEEVAWAITRRVPSAQVVARNAAFWLLKGGQ